MLRLVLYFFLLLVFPKGFGKLIGAGGGLESATDAFQARDDFIDRHSDTQRGDSLRIARASAVKLYGDDAVVFDRDVDLAGADPLGRIRNMIHKSFLSFKEWMDSKADNIRSGNSARIPATNTDETRARFAERSER